MTCPICRSRDTEPHSAGRIRCRQCRGVSDAPALVPALRAYLIARDSDEDEAGEVLMPDYGGEGG